MTSLENEGWDCYPEVVIPGGRADIVAVRKFPFNDQKCVHIIETKSTWSLSLLEQGFNRIGLAHHVSVAAPTKHSRFFERLCRERGIGMYTLARSRDPQVDYYRILRPKLFRHKGSYRHRGPNYTLSLLHEDQKNYAPGGTAADGYSTPFSRTMDRCVEYVKHNPGCTVNDIVKNVESHYASGASFRQGVLTWLETRNGVTIRTDRKPYQFFPDD